jgi:hypothetical protein
MHPLLHAHEPAPPADGFDLSLAMPAPHEAASCRRCGRCGQQAGCHTLSTLFTNGADESASGTPGLDAAAAQE